jgi:hypothetical protein
MLISRSEYNSSVNEKRLCPVDIRINLGLTQPASFLANEMTLISFCLNLIISNFIES